MVICGKANKTGVRETGQLSTAFHFFSIAVLALTLARTLCLTRNNSLFSYTRKSKTVNRPFSSTRYVGVEETRFHVSTSCHASGDMDVVGHARTPNPHVR